MIRYLVVAICNLFSNDWFQDILLVRWYMINFNISIQQISIPNRCIDETLHLLWHDNWIRDAYDILWKGVLRLLFQCCINFLFMITCYIAIFNGDTILTSNFRNVWSSIKCIICILHIITGTCRNEKLF